MKKAFTMVELIFVIVVLGILASVALPRLAANRDDAEITKVKAQVASIRAGIQTKRNANLLQQAGKGASASGYPAADKLHDGNGLFGGVLNVAIPEGDNWSKNADDKYVVKAGKKETTFTYYPTKSADEKHKAGSFECIETDELCTIINK